MATGDQDWNLALKKGAEFSSATDLKLVEVLRYPSLEKSQWSERSLNNTTLKGLFDERDISGTGGLPGGPRQPSSGLRLLIANCDWFPERNLIEVSVTKDAFCFLEQHLELHERFVNLITGGHIRGLEATKYRQNVPLSKGFLLKVPFYSSNFFQIEVRHELGSSITYGFLVLLEATGLHPALLPVTLFNEVVLGIVREVQIHYQELETLAVTCGQNRYDGLPLTDLPDPLDSDFVGATRWLTCIRHGNAANIVKAQCMFLGLGQASSWLRSIELAKKMDCNTTSDFRSDRDATRSLLSCKNTHAVLQLFHYMAAKNAKANLSIAETSATIAKASKEDSAAMRTIASESKRDSSTMKTISLLGMIFLPGTFIEAIFLVTVFNWEGSGAPILGAGFKYYWAVTIPLTILVLTTWALGMFLPWKKWLIGGFWKPKDSQGRSEGRSEDV